MSATITDRLETIQHSLVRIEGCIRLLGISEIDGRIATVPNIIDAALEDVSNLQLELIYLTNVPAAVLATPAPDDDDREEREGGAR